MDSFPYTHKQPLGNNTLETQHHSSPASRPIHPELSCLHSFVTTSTHPIPEPGRKSYREGNRPRNQAHGETFASWLRWKWKVIRPIRQTTSGHGRLSFGLPRRTDRDSPYVPGRDSFQSISITAWIWTMLLMATCLLVIRSSPQRHLIPRKSLMDDDRSSFGFRFLRNLRILNSTAGLI